MKLNLNTLLIVLGSLGVFAPDLTGLAAYLSSIHVGWITHVVHGLGLLAAFCSAAPLVVPRLRAFLALFGLATAPGARAPWDPSKVTPPSDAIPTPVDGIRRIGPSSAGPLRGGSGYGDKIGALLVLAGSLLLGSTAWAQAPLVANDVAPPLSFCFGASTTCVVEDFGLQAVNYDLTAKKWSGGIQAAGFGYALLFASDQPYASGFSVHATFNFSQAAPSFLAPTFAVVVAHWFEFGYTPVFYDGSIGQQLTLMIGLNAEELTSLVTGKRLGARLAAAKLAASAGKAVQ